MDWRKPYREDRQAGAARLGLDSRVRSSQALKAFEDRESDLIQRLPASHAFLLEGFVFVLVLSTFGDVTSLH